MPGDFQTDYFPCFATSVTAVTEEARNSWVRHCLPVEAHVRGAFKGVPRALLGSAVREGGWCVFTACFVLCYKGVPLLYHTAVQGPSCAPL